MLSETKILDTLVYRGKCLETPTKDHDLLHQVYLLVIFLVQVSSIVFHHRYYRNNLCMNEYKAKIDAVVNFTPGRITGILTNRPIVYSYTTLYIHLELLFWLTVPAANPSHHHPLSLPVYGSEFGKCWPLFGCCCLCVLVFLLRFIEGRLNFCILHSWGSNIFEFQAGVFPYFPNHFFYSSYMFLLKGHCPHSFFPGFNSLEVWNVIKSLHHDVHHIFHFIRFFVCFWLVPEWYLLFQVQLISAFLAHSQ